MQLCGSLSILQHCLYLGLEWNWPFPVLWWVFQMCWYMECITFIASYFRIWNSSTEIPLPPIALFVVMLLKACLTLYFRMFGSSPVITPLWLSGSKRSFLYNSSVYSCHHFLISSFSVHYFAHLCIKCTLGISKFLEEISSPSHSIVFLYFFASITEEGVFISPCFSLELHIQMGISFLFSFACSFSSFLR